jgi:hypothetical protein
MRLALDLAAACERLARCVQPLADAEGREWLVVKPHREGNVDGYVPVLPWAVPLEWATALELRHAAGKVVPGLVAKPVEHVPPTIAEHGDPEPASINMHTTPAEPPPAPQTPDPRRPRSRGVEPQTGRG